MYFEDALHFQSVLHLIPKCDGEDPDNLMSFREGFEDSREESLGRNTSLIRIVKGIPRRNLPRIAWQACSLGMT